MQYFDALSEDTKTISKVIDAGQFESMVRCYRICPGAGLKATRALLVQQMPSLAKTSGKVSRTELTFQIAEGDATLPSQDKILWSSQNCEYLNNTQC